MDPLSFLIGIRNAPKEFCRQLNPNGLELCHLTLEQISHVFRPNMPKQTAPAHPGNAQQIQQEKTPKSRGQPDIRQSRGPLPGLRKYSPTEQVVSDGTETTLLEPTNLTNKRGTTGKNQRVRACHNFKQSGIRVWAKDPFGFQVNQGCLSLLPKPTARSVSNFKTAKRGLCGLRQQRFVFSSQMSPWQLVSFRQHFAEGSMSSLPPSRR